LNLIDIKVSFEFYLFTMTDQSITNTCSLLSIVMDFNALVIISRHNYNGLGVTL